MKDLFAAYHAEAKRNKMHVITSKHIDALLYSLAEHSKVQAWDIRQLAAQVAALGLTNAMAEAGSKSGLARVGPTADATKHGRA